MIIRPKSAAYVIKSHEVKKENIIRKAIGIIKNAGEEEEDGTD